MNGIGYPRPYANYGTVMAKITNHFSHPQVGNAGVTIGSIGGKLFVRRKESKRFSMRNSVVEVVFKRNGL